jgi:uncharacterized Fe-S center protein
MAKVYFYKIKKQTPEVLEKAGREVSGIISEIFNSQDDLAVKVHFGEPGNTTYLPPDFAKAVCKELKDKVKNLALVECTVLYKGGRSFGSSHKKVAEDHGFNFAPVEILDGERGDEEVKIKIDGKHFTEAKIGKGIEKFNSILAISHVKGHMAVGFGGALKNIGMGLGSKGGKMAMHQTFKIAPNPDTCIGCGMCVKNCPAGALSIENGKAKIDYNKCIGCGFCISVCPVGAIEIPWRSGTAKDLQERIAEYSVAVLRGRKSFFVNVLTNITKDCDCHGESQKPIMEDIGILLSDDIVAIDQASLDLVGKDNFTKSYINPEDQIDHAVLMGLGKKEYTLINLN